MPAQREGRRLAPLAILLVGIFVSLSSLVHPNPAASSTLAAHAYDRTDDGDWAVVGAPSRDGFRGVALVYHRSGRSWVLDATLSPPERGPFARFGGAVAIDGNTLVVGAPWDDGWKGTAYVYERTGKAWRLISRMAPDAAVGDRFGSRVGIAAGVVNLGAESGTVARYRRAGAEWTQAGRALSSAADFGPGRAPEASLVETVAAADPRNAVPDQIESTAVVDTPAFLRATDGVYEDRTELRWSPVSGGSYLFKIYRRPAGPPAALDTLIRVASQGDSLYPDTAGRAGVEYRYSLTLLDLSNNTESAARTDRGRRIIFAPIGFSASDATYEGFVRLSWTDRSNIEAGYRIDRNGSPLVTTSTDAQTYDDVTAVPGTTYSYGLVAFDAAGAATAPVTDSGRSAFIAAPLSVSATDGQYPDTVVVTWVDNTALEVNYRVYRNGALLVTLPAGAQSYKDGTAVNGTAYEYCVAAVNGSSLESARGCDFGGIGILPGPSHVSATDGVFDDKVTITWQDTSATEDGFLVYRMPVATSDSTLVAHLGAGIRSFDDPGGQPGQAYSYCVVAFSNRGGRSAPVCDDGLRAMVIAPKSVIATDGAFEDRVDLAWLSTSTSAVLFKVYRDGVAIHTVSGNQRTYSDEAVPSGVTADYTVTAVTALGVESPPTADNGFRRIVVPASVKASDDEIEDRVSVTWTDLSQIEDGFFVYRRLAGTADPLRKIATRPSNTGSAEDLTGVPGARYDYFVTAFQLYGPGRADTTESASGSNTGSRSLQVPTFVDATDGEFENKIVVAWVDNSRYEEAYQVWRGSLLASDSVMVGVLPPNSNRYVDSTGTLAGAYRYSVFAVDSLGGAVLGRSSAGQDVGSASILPPAAVNASDAYRNHVVVAWIDQSARETGYRISRDGVPIGTVGPNVTAFQDLLASGPHIYCVRTVAVADSSDPVCDGGGTPVTADTSAVIFNARVEESANPGFDEGFRYFGASLDGDSERLIVGAPQTNPTFRTRFLGSGKAIIYRKTGSGFEREQVLAPPDTTIDGMEFGAIVALSGTHAAVVAKGPGTVSFYERDPQTDVWALLQTTSGGVSSFALDGEWAIVGQASALRFYHHQGASWTLAQTINSPGVGVALSGTTAVAGYTGVSAPLSVHVYDLVAGTWTESQALQDPAPSPYGAFGNTVDIDGDRLVVGGGVELIPFPPGPSSLISGIVHVFERNPTTRIWSPALQLRGETRADNAGQLSYFGGALSVQDDDILVGAPFDNLEFPEHGAVFHFKRRTDGTWARRELRSRDPKSGELGTSVKVIGQDLLAGAPYARCETGPFPVGCRPLPQLVNVSFPAGTVEVLSSDINTSPIASVSASDGNYKDRVQMRWTYDFNDQTGFKIYRDGTLITTADPAVRVYTDFDAEPGRTHEFCVTVVRTDGSESDARCDFGRRPPDGNITGRVSTQGSAGVSGAQVVLDPAPNRALLFDGSAGTMTVSDGGLFGNAFTVEFWYRGHAAGTAATLLRHASATTADAFSVVDPANLTVFVSGAQKVTGVAVNDGAWHHVAIDRTRAGGALNVYKDGLLAFNDTFAAAAGIDSVGSLVFGASLTGAVDDIRIWSRVRTAAEIADARGLPLAGTEEALAAYWSLDAYQGAGAEEPVGNRYGRLSGGAHWIGEAAPLLAFAVTDAQGNYVLPKLRYGTSTTFKVTPVIEGHQFNPAFKTITLSTGNPVQNEVGFTDITSYTASGSVIYANTSCFAANVPIYVDGQARGTTDGTGRYAVPLPPGDHTIEARADGHTFSPSIIRLTGITGDVGGRDFRDVTVRRLSGLVAGGCNIPIGTLKLTIESEDRCFSDTVTTSAEYAEALPPLKFFVRVVDVTSASGGPSQASVIRFFDNLGAREVDLSAADQTLDFKYRAPLAIEISGLPEADSSCALPVSVVGQTERYRMTIRVFENYGALGRCDLDTGTVTVFDEILDQEQNPVTLVVKNGEAKLPTENGFVLYETAGNTPNIFAGRVDSEGRDRSYQKSLTVVAEAEGQDPIAKSVWAIVTGHRPRTATFTAESEGIPLLILHDPPGDHSFSFVDQESTFCTKFSNAGLEGYASGFEGKVHFGLKAQIGFIYMTPVQVQFGVAGGLKVGVETKQGNDMEICVTTSQGYKTSAENLFVGRDGDVYVGLALNLVFAKTDVIRVQGCEVVPAVEVTFGVDNVQSAYNYTDWHIRNTIIPQLAELAELTPANSVRFDADRENWEAHLAMNDSLKRVAPLERNRSFSAGAEYSYSAKSDTSRASTWGVKVFTNAEFAQQFDFDVAGIGGEFKFFSKMDFSYEREGSSSSSTSRTIGYTLSDDDIGDVFSVNVKKDLLYGTPIFDVAAGTSSCPWEPWLDPVSGQPRTQKVDNPTLTIQRVGPVVTPVGSPAVFTLNMTNGTESGALRECLILPFQESNPGGAIIKINGVASNSGSSFFIEPRATMQATMTVERGPNRYSYHDLEIAMLAPCEFDLFRNGGPLNLSSIVKVDVDFDAPCSDITLVRPLPGWSVGAGTDSLQLILDDFQLEISESEALVSVGAEYQLSGTDAWLPIGAEIPLASLPRDSEGEPQSVTIKWPVTAVPAGTYSVRAFTRCGGGRNYSGSATGVIDRSAPQVFGTPQPADGTLSFGEDISITFNEDIECASANAITVHLETTTGTPQPLNAPVTCNGRTLVIAPTADLSAYEGQTLRATVTGIKDRVGNASVTRTWTFLVRQGDLAWAQSSVSQDVGYGSGGRVAVNLVNGLNQRVRYTLSGLPSWLTAEPVATDTIPARSQAAVAFLISPTASLGAHDTTIVATANTVPPTTARTASLSVHVNVLKVSPTWTVTAADYEHSMTVRAKVYVDADSLILPEDMLAAFVGSQVRGVAHPQHVSDGWRYFLTVYGKPPAYERVRFQVWDSRTSKTYTATDKTQRFAADTTLGSLGSPFEIRTRQPSPAIEQVIPVNAGWTWFSVNRRPTAKDDRTVAAVLSNLTPSPGDLVKSQDGTIATFDAVAGWVGTLDTLGVTKSYRLKTAQAGQIVYESTRVLPSAFPIPIKKGWNWIGYTPDNVRDLSTSLVNLVSSNADILRSQTAFAEYGASSWAGSLSQMGPGQGYALYRSNVATGQFLYTDLPTGPLLAAAPDVGEAEASAANAPAAAIENAAALPGWEVDDGAFQYDMVVTASLAGLTLGPNHQVAAVVDGEIRGVARPVHVPALGRTFVFLMVRSNRTRGETVHFQTLDRASGKVYEIAGAVDFESDAVLGSTTTPLPLESTGNVLANLATPAVFELGPSQPNPLLGGGTAMVRYAVPRETHVSLELFDVNGRRVRNIVDAWQTPGWYDVAIEPTGLRGGVYFYRMRAGSFVATRRMVVVR